MPRVRRVQRRIEIMRQHVERLLHAGRASYRLIDQLRHSSGQVKRQLRPHQLAGLRVERIPAIAALDGRLQVQLSLRRKIFVLLLEFIVQLYPNHLLELL